MQSSAVKWFANRVSSALQVTPVHYLFKPTDNATIEHFRAVTEETGMPVIIYNVVPWSYIEPELLLPFNARDSWRDWGKKQSAGDMKLFADLMIMADADHLIFSAVDALLYFLLRTRGAWRNRSNSCGCARTQRGTLGSHGFRPIG